MQSSVADRRLAPRRKRKDSAVTMSGAGCCPWAECLGMESRHHRVSLVTQSVKKIRLQCRRGGFDPRVGKTPWRRAWQPTSVPCLEKSYGEERSLGG